MFPFNQAEMISDSRRESSNQKLHPWDLELFSWVAFQLPSSLSELSELSELHFCDLVADKVAEQLLISECLPHRQ